MKAYFFFVFYYVFRKHFNIIQVSFVYVFIYLQQQFLIQLREIIYKIQWVLNFVCDACREFTQGSHLLRLNQLGLRRF